MRIKSFFEKSGTPVVLALELLIATTCLISNIKTVNGAPRALYVSPNGSDSNPGTIDRPFLTAQHGYDSMACGDTLYLRAGTYNGGIGGTYGRNPFCNSWTSPLTIQNYQGETVILTNTYQQVIMGFATDIYPSSRDMYMILKGVIFDAATGAVGASGCVDGLNVDHVRFIDVECKNAQRAGITPHGAYWEFINVNAHHNGLDKSPTHARSHGIFLTGGHCLIEGGRFWDNGGYGIQIFDSGSSTNSYNIVRNALIYDNNLNTDTSDPLQGVGGGGMVLANGTGNIAYNNVLWHNGQINIQVNPTCVSCGVYNNTQTQGLVGLMLAGSVNAVVTNNIFYGNANGDIVDNGIGSKFSNNLTNNPMFTDLNGRDLTLRPGSPAIDAGVDLSSIFNSDFSGGLRPNGAAFDIGAFESGTITVLRVNSDADSPKITISLSPHH